jgi:signal transduction histidine kinase
MRVGLRTSVAILVAILNLLAFSTGLAWLSGAITDWNADLESEYEENTLDQLEALVDSKGNLQVTRILRWPGWRTFQDAVVVSSPEERSDGSFEVRGAHLAIRGTHHRPSDFPEQEILSDIHNACSLGSRIANERGVCIPVRHPGGEVWGGCWFILEPRRGIGPLLIRLLPWFVLSTLVLTLFTFGAVRIFVLDPVRRLAQAAQSVREGNLSARTGSSARNDELGQLMRTFDSMAEEVQGFNARLAREVDEATRLTRAAEAAAMTQRRLASTGELAAGVAHEINNPLGGMMNAVEALSDPELDPKRRVQYLELVQGGLERVRTTVGRLLRLAPRDARPERVDLRAQIGDALGLVQHRADRQRVTIWVGRPDHSTRLHDPGALDHLGALPDVHGQGGELGQALLNLLVNALDALQDTPASETSKRIDMFAEVRGDFVVLIVQDNGPGADQATLDRAADAFFTTKDPGKGTGLGLAIVHSTIVGHGGRLVLSSPPREGFRAELILPAAPADDPAQTEASTDSPGSSS